MTKVEYSTGGVYHVYNQGVAKLPTYHDEFDYQNFLDIIRYLLIGFLLPSIKNRVNKDALPVSRNASSQSNGYFKDKLQLLAYCLMPNHFHLLVRLLDQNVSLRNLQVIPEFTKRLLITYAHKFNSKYDRGGAVYRGRTKVKPITRDDYATHVTRYIHLNPVKAGLVTKPEDWHYSDYRQYTKHVSLRNLPLSETNFILDYFNGQKNKYIDFVNSEISYQNKEELVSLFLD